jgi:MFS family permease
MPAPNENRRLSSPADVDHANTHDETTALLGDGDGSAAVGNGTVAGADAAVADASRDRWQDDRPLPVMQILLLCYARMCEPIAYFSIFPFINQMIEEVGGIPKTDVGFYSGLIESLFSLTQMMVMLFWGRAADRVGRKPVLVVSLIGFTFATAIFGFASSITEMIIFRCLAGVFAGTIVTIRTMINEHSTAKTQAQAFSWFAFANNLGLFIGPLVGGALAEPAKQYGGVFRDIRFFTDFPFALSTLATGIFSATATIVAILFITETMPKTSKESSEAPTTTLELLKSPGVGVVLWLYGHVMLLAFAYTAVCPVFWFTPVPLGGFGFSELQISLFMALTGVSQAIWLLVVFPPLQRRYSTGFVLRLCSHSYPIFFAICPSLNLLLRQDTDEVRIIFWVFGTTLLCVGVGISMAFTAIQLALNDISPSPQTLGTLNALALALVSGVRAFAPVVFTSIFAVGVREQILKGHLIWVVLCVVGATFAVATRYLPKKAEGKISRDDDDE